MTRRRRPTAWPGFSTWHRDAYLRLLSSGLAEPFTKKAAVEYLRHNFTRNNLAEAQRRISGLEEVGLLERDGRRWRFGYRPNHVEIEAARAADRRMSKHWKRYLIVSRLLELDADDSELLVNPDTLFRMWWLEACRDGDLNIEAGGSERSAVQLCNEIKKLFVKWGYEWSYHPDRPGSGPYKKR